MSIIIEVRDLYSDNGSNSIILMWLYGLLFGVGLPAGNFPAEFPRLRCEATFLRIKTSPHDRCSLAQHDTTGFVHSRCRTSIKDLAKT